LYILTDSQEQTIDLTSYYTKSETDTLISGFKNIEYLTTDAYNSLENKDENKLYILTDSQEPTIDLSQFSLTNHTHDSYVLNASLSDNYYNKSYIDSSLAEFSLTSHTHDSYALVDEVYSKKEVDGMIPKICTLDIYAIANGDVTVTEEMWNEWIYCINSHGIFYQDNGNVR